MKIALVYDRINKLGGAERVLASLHQIWPNAPLYTAVYHKHKAPWADDWHIRSSFLDRFPPFRDKHEYLAPFMPYAFESFTFDDYDVVISITSAEAKGIITNPHQLHICYMLTPTRYLWSHTHHYRGRGVRSSIYLPFMSSLRHWDYIAAKRPDHIIAISKAVELRVRKYYRRDVSQVIYPPVRFDFFSKHSKDCDQNDQGYFLVVSRLVSYKSLDKLIKSFRHIPQEKLIVVGIGSQKRSLMDLSSPNVELKGYVSDTELVCLYHHAKALIIPQEEDFGIVSLEAQSTGTPVIALNRGGAIETIIPDKTGILIDSIGPHQLIAAFDALNSHTWYDKSIRRHAGRFSTQRFQQTFKNSIEELWQSHHLK